jgi:beta-glucosidase
VDLKPGEESEVRVELDRRAFTFYDVEQHDWLVEAGEFEILVGASSQNIRLTGSLQLASTQKASAADKEKLAAYYNFPKGALVPQRDFEALLGHPLPPNQIPEKGSYTLNTPIDDMSDSLIGRRLFKVLEKQMSKMVVGQEDTPTALMMMTVLHEMPLRSMLMTDDGPFTREMLEALLAMINGHTLKGLGALLKAMMVK